MKSKRALIATILVASVSLSLPGQTPPPPPAPPVLPSPSPASPLPTTTIIKQNIVVSEFVNSVRSAQGICFGLFELVEFPRGSMSVGPATIGGPGQGTTYRFKIAFSGSSKARVYVYPKEVQREYAVAQPCNISEDARKKAIVSASVSAALIRGAVQVRESGIAAISIPKLRRQSNGSLTTGLHLVASESTPVERPIRGGVIRQSGRLVIENVEDAVEIVAEPAVKGHLLVRSSAAELRTNVGLIADVPHRQELTLTLDRQASAEVAVDTDTGSASLQSGAFHAAEFNPPYPLAGGVETTLGRLHLRYHGLRAKELHIAVFDGVVKGHLRTVSLNAVGGTYDGPPRADVATAGDATATDVGGNGELSADAIDLKPTSIDGFELVASAIVLSGPLGVSGPGKIVLERADSNEVSGTILFDTASIQNARTRDELAVVEVMHLSGRSALQGYEGRLAGRMRTGRLGRALVASDDGALAGQFARDGSLPFSTTLKTGTFGLLPPNDSQLAYSAGITGGALGGVYSPSAGTLAFAPNAVALTLSDLQAHGARILGGAPSFPAGPIKLTNPEAVSPLRSGAEGSLAFSCPSFSIADSAVWTAARDYEAPMGGSNLSSIGPAVLRAVLGTGEIVPAGGILSKEHIDIAPPTGISSVTFRLGGADVEVKSLKIARLELRPSFDVAQLKARAILAATGIDLALGRITHPSYPTFSGTATAPVAVGRLSGIVEVTKQPLEFTNLAIENAGLALQEVSFATPDKLQIQASGLSLQVEVLNDSEAKGHFALTGGRIHTEGESTTNATIKELSLQFAGTKEAPLATGEIHLDTLNVVSDTTMEVEKECGSNRMPVRISAQTGALGGPISIAGARTDFTLASNDAQAQLFRPFDFSNPYRCEWNHTIQKAVTVNHPCCEVCFALGIPYPCNCRTCTSIIVPEIGVTWALAVNSINASGMVTQIKVRPDPGKGMKVCEGHLTQLNPAVIDFAITPIIHGGNAVTDAINNMILVGVGAIETTIHNTVIGPFLSALSLTKIGNSFYLFGKCD